MSKSHIQLLQEIKKYINNHKQTPYVSSFESFNNENLAKFIISYLGNNGVRHTNFHIGRSEYGPSIDAQNGSIVWYFNDEYLNDEEHEVKKMPAGTVPQNVRNLLTRKLTIPERHMLYEKLLKLNKRALKYIATNLQGGNNISDRFQDILQVQDLNRSINHRVPIHINPKQYWSAVKPKALGAVRVQKLRNSAAERVFAPGGLGYKSAEQQFKNLKRTNSLKSISKKPTSNPFFLNKSTIRKSRRIQ